MKRFLFIVPLLAYVYSFGQFTPKETKVLTGLGKTLSDDLRKDDLHGSMSVAVIKKGKGVWAAAFGYSNREKDMPVDTGTLYRICSITKVFTAALLMELVEEGKVRLDDPLEKYVPEIMSVASYPKHRKVTLLELASHTSGLNREPELPEASFGAPDQWENKLLSCLPYSSFYTSPGQEFLYSNVGYALLGLALERATGVPYIQLIQQRIFIPLQMNNSYFTIPDDKRDKIAYGIDNKTDKINTSLPLRQIDGMGYRVPNGGIWTTPSDMAKFAMALLSGQLIKAASLREMLTVPPGGKNYGLGIMFMRNRQVSLIGHNGSDPGYTSLFAVEPNSGDIFILFRNYNVGSTEMDDVARDILGSL